MLRHRKAQSTAEYVIVLGLIVAAVIAMQTYVKRGFQGRVKDAVDYVDQGGQGGMAVNFATKQYEPYYMDTSFTSVRDVTEIEELKEGGAVTRKIEGEDITIRHGHQTILAPEESGRPEIKPL